jgi:hypothetical protein
LKFVEGHGKLTHDYYRYYEEDKAWKLAETPKLDTDTEMGNNVVSDGESATDQELLFEGRPDFVRDICEEHDATSLMDAVLRNPKDADAAERFLVAVNPTVIEKSIDEGLDDQAYLLNMGFIRQAVMVCAGHGVLIQGMKQNRLTKLDGKDISVYESQRDEHRKGFVKEIGSKGYPLEWRTMFDKTVAEIANEHKDKTQPLYTMQDVANAAGEHKSMPSISVYKNYKKAFEDENAKTSDGAKLSEQSPPAATPESASGTSKVNATVASVEYLGKSRPIGVVRIANWNQCATARANNLAYTPRHEILVQMNETGREGTSLLPYWDIVKADHLGFDVEAYGEENISAQPGLGKDITTRVLAEFHIQGIAVRPRTDDSGKKRMPDMLILGRCGEDGKAQFFTRSTLAGPFGERAVVKKILHVMKQNNMTPPTIPEGVSDRTRQIWTGEKAKRGRKVKTDKRVETPSSENDHNETSDADDGYILSNKPRNQGTEGVKKNSGQTNDDSELKNTVKMLAEQVQSIQAAMAKLTEQFS